MTLSLNCKPNTPQAQSARWWGDDDLGILQPLSWWWASLYNQSDVTQQQIYSRLAEKEKNGGAAVSRSKSRPHSDWNVVVGRRTKCLHSNVKDCYLKLDLLKVTVQATEHWDVLCLSQDLSFFQSPGKTFFFSWLHNIEYCFINAWTCRNLQKLNDTPH